MKVFVYFNLHKKLFSVKSLEGPTKGKVIAHQHSIILDEVQFKVSEAGRQRVLREKKKNVHAGVVGNWSGAINDVTTLLKEAVTYNPYKYSTFVEKETETPIQKASQAFLIDKKIFI